MKALLGAAIAIGLAAFASDPQQAGASTETCDVLVIGSDGKPLAGLGVADFLVLSDGEPAAVTSVTSVPTALSMVLIADATASQPLRRYEIQNAVATSWIPNLGPNDRARLGVLASPLNQSPVLPTELKTALGIVRPLIDRGSAEPSPLWDAAAAAIDTLAAEPPSRAIVFLSDGRSNANRLGLDDVAERALAADVTVSTVSEGGERVVTQAEEAAARVRPDASLRWLADYTGGVFLEDGVARRTLRPQIDPFAYVKELVQTPNRPGPLLEQIMTGLRQRYRVTFSPPASGGRPAAGRLHRLGVSVRTPGANVRVKARYLASARFPTP